MLSRTLTSGLERSITIAGHHARAIGGPPSTTSSTKQDAPHCSPSSVPADSVLLLRNLRLLDLDRLPDWPGIVCETFGHSKDALTTQKERVRAAEWVLYRLFEIWDPRETKAKLRPLFPALEPLQSIKLRAALLQWLVSLKSNGTLGRECMIRKSMLDECKSEKFEEVLLHFSTAVLRRVVQQQTGKKRSTPVTQQLGLGMSCSSGTLDGGVALMYAYKTSLRRALHERDQTKLKLKGFTGILQHMIHDIEGEKHNLEREVKDQQAKNKSMNADATELKKSIRQDCAGDASWQNVALSGEQDYGRNAMIEDTFDKIWQNELRTDKNVPYDLIPSGMLADLEGRVKSQRERLAKWRVFQNELSQRNGDLIIAQSPVKTPFKSPQKNKNSSHSTPRRTVSTRKPRQGTETSLRLQALQASPSKRRVPIDQGELEASVDPDTPKPLGSPPDVFKRPQRSQSDLTVPTIVDEDPMCDDMPDVKLSTNASSPRRTRLPSPTKTHTRLRSPVQAPGDAQHDLTTTTHAGPALVSSHILASSPSPRRPDQVPSTAVAHAMPATPPHETLSERTARTMAAWAQRPPSPTKDRATPAPKSHRHTRSVPQQPVRPSPECSPDRMATLMQGLSIGVDDDAAKHTTMVMPQPKDPTGVCENALDLFQPSFQPEPEPEPEPECTEESPHPRPETTSGSCEATLRPSSPQVTPTRAPDPTSYEDWSAFKPRKRLHRTPPGSPSPCA